MLADSGRRQAQRLYRAHDCVRCSATEKAARIERHHIDGDTTHNTPENVETLCSKCHGIEHRRLPLAMCRVCWKSFRPKRRRRSTLCGDLYCHEEWGRMNAVKRWGHHA